MRKCSMKSLKKLVVGAITIALMVAMVGCGNSNGNSNGNQNSGDQGYVSVVDAKGEVGKKLVADFAAEVSANPDATAQEIADKLMADESIPFAPMTMEVENGLLNGFGNAEITGFDQGVVFSPMIGSIPFVGYVFILPSGADTTAFTDTLQTNADLRWNVCTEADDMVIATAGNKVLFVMCPLNFDEE